MLTRRGFATCALCALTGFAATGLEAETPSGIRREVLKRMDGPAEGYETIIASADIDAGVQVPRHIHPGVESAYIVEGSGILSVDGLDDCELKAGDVAQIPIRRPHSLKNGEKPMRIISTYVIEKGQPIAIPA